LHWLLARVGWGGLGRAIQWAEKGLEGEAEPPGLAHYPWLP
jgi:hypothetical protein